MTFVLALDCSTTAAKAIVWDAQGRAVSEGRAAIALANPRPGWWEQDPKDWWTASVTAIRVALGAADPAGVGAICVACQRETFAAIGPGGDALRPAIVWMDERAKAEVDAFAGSFGRERLHRTTGKPPCVTPSLYKIAWLRANEPEVFARARFVDVHALIVMRLTGAFATGVAAADPMGMVDLARGAWSDDVLAAAGLDRTRLPALYATGAQIGGVSAEASKATGLVAGTPVVAGGGDGQVSALGAGLSGSGRAYLNLGTAAVLGVLSDEYVTDVAFRTMAGATPKTFVLESDLKGGTFTLDWFLSRFGGGATAAELDREAAEVLPGAEGLVVVPYWAGVMNPYWDDSASGIVVGLGGGHGRAHLWRAILEGIALEQRLALEGIDRAAGRAVEELVVLGGGSKSDLWCRIVADATGRRVVRSRTAEATCLGAGVLAAAHLGLHRSIDAAVRSMTGTAEAFEPGPDAERYARLFEDVYRKLYPALRAPLARLSDLQ